ncbi:hypothetical protein BH10PSE16_BH10PSE16_07550 [soil metagenome]
MPEFCRACSQRLFSTVLGLHRGSNLFTGASSGMSCLLPGGAGCAVRRARRPDVRGLSATSLVADAYPQPGRHFNVSLVADF